MANRKPSPGASLAFQHPNTLRRNQNDPKRPEKSPKFSKLLIQSIINVCLRTFGKVSSLIVSGERRRKQAEHQEQRELAQAAECLSADFR